MKSGSILASKVILVTGGSGTVGQALVKELLRHGPRAIRIYSRDETKQFEMMGEFAAHAESLRFLIGDVRDKERLLMAVEGVDYIFHLAAMKHVLLSSYNPFEAAKTNILGTQNVIEVARSQNVAKVIYASTDKAVNPTNIMGVSKLAAEHLITAANCYRGQHPTIFASVRFGNVLGSRGSAIPLFIRQICNNEPLTITNPAMTRFVMTTSQAGRLLIKACQLALGGEIFVSKMARVRLSDLVDALCQHFRADSSRDIVGEFPYEKMDEELMTRDESLRGLENEDMFISLPPTSLRQLINIDYTYSLSLKKAEVKGYSSASGPFLMPEEIITILKEDGLLS